jgi:hypothetical protein
MFVLCCCTLRTKGKIQESKDKETSTDEKQTVQENTKKMPVGATFSAPVQTVPGAHPASYTMGTMSLSRG